ncbi:hypothetical protein DFH08DRAFT_78139 [Mycena albidolilacea]|uniref:Uncharacterized protein n=1 Tax=Mycena albidolilacea TaxID=1033008 RepID=A0AAD7EWJ2_9AGAR|nr:hypothetical protein DFH08DRAFT_78139 [Mycena albidolilacea]
MERPFLRTTSSIPTVFYKSSASTTLPTAPAAPRHHQHASTSNTDASPSSTPLRAPALLLRAHAHASSPGGSRSRRVGRMARCVRSRSGSCWGTPAALLLHHQHASTSTSNTDASASQHPSVHRRSSSRAPTPTLRARADLVPDGSGEWRAACVREGVRAGEHRRRSFYTCKCGYGWTEYGRLCSASPRWCAHTNTLVWAPSRSSPQAPRYSASWSSVRATPPPCPSSSPCSSPRCSPPPQNAIWTPTSPLLPEASRALRTALFTRHLQRILDALDAFPTPSAVPDPSGAVAAKSLPLGVLHSLIVSGNRHVAQSPQPFPSPTSTPVRSPDVQSVPVRTRWW